MELLKLLFVAIWLGVLGRVESILMLPLEYSHEEAKKLFEYCPTLEQPWNSYMACSSDTLLEDSHPAQICSKVMRSLACYRPLIESLRTCPHAQANTFITMSEIYFKQWNYLCQRGGYNVMELIAMFFEKEVCMKSNSPEECRFGDHVATSPFHQDNCEFWEKSADCLRGTWRNCQHQVKDILNHLYAFTAETVCNGTGDFAFESFTVDSSAIYDGSTASCGTAPGDGNETPTAKSESEATTSESADRTITASVDTSTGLSTITLNDAISTETTTQSQNTATADGREESTVDISSIISTTAIVITVLLFSSVIVLYVSSLPVRAKSAKGPNTDKIASHGTDKVPVDVKS